MSDGPFIAGEWHPDQRTGTGHAPEQGTEAVEEAVVEWLTINWPRIKVNNVNGIRDFVRSMFSEVRALTDTPNEGCCDSCAEAITDQTYRLCNQCVTTRPVPILTAAPREPEPDHTFDAMQELRMENDRLREALEPQPEAPSETSGTTNPTDCEGIAEALALAAPLSEPKCDECGKPADGHFHQESPEPSTASGTGVAAPPREDEPLTVSQVAMYMHLLAHQLESGMGWDDTDLGMLREGAAALAPVHDGDEALADRLEVQCREHQAQIKGILLVRAMEFEPCRNCNLCRAATRLRGGR